MGAPPSLGTQTFREPLHDRKAKHKPAALRAVSALIVLMEYVREFVCSDTDATVPDFDANVVAASPASEQNSSLVSVSDRIRQQIADHLREHLPVAADDEFGT